MGGPSKPSFFACYLLCSQNPRFKGRTYIGFTVNPARRIRQHNGEITSGARTTQKKRPWEMILCIYGFPSQVHALQFEWAWQHPFVSIAVREAAVGLKSMRGVGGKVMLLYTMLNLPEWKSMDLTVNVLSTKHLPLTKGCPSLPPQMHIKVGPLEDLPCYRLPHSELSDSGECENESDGESDGNIMGNDKLVLLQKKGGTKQDGVPREGDRNCGWEACSSHKVLAEISNIVSHMRPSQDDAPKPKKHGCSRKTNHREHDKDELKMSPLNKENTVLCQPKKRGRPKLRQKGSIGKEKISEYCGSLLSKAPGLSLEECENIAISSLGNDKKQAQLHTTEGHCLPAIDVTASSSSSTYVASLVSWKTNSELSASPCLASPFTWKSKEVYAEPSSLPCSPFSWKSKAAKAEPFSTPDLASTPTWEFKEAHAEPHNNHALMVKAVSSDLQKGTTLAGQWDADMLFSKHLPKETSPRWTSLACGEDEAKRMIEKSPSYHCEDAEETSVVLDVSQFSPLWSPSPLPANYNEDGAKSMRITEKSSFKLNEDSARKVSCSLRFSTLSPSWTCSPSWKTSGASTIPGLSQAMLEDSLSTRLFRKISTSLPWGQSPERGTSASIQGLLPCGPCITSTPDKGKQLEVIDLTDSPASQQSASSIGKLTFI